MSTASSVFHLKTCQEAKKFVYGSWERNAATLLLVSVCRACYLWASDTVLLSNLLQMGLTHRLGYTRCDTVLL